MVIECDLLRKLHHHSGMLVERAEHLAETEMIAEGNRLVAAEQDLMIDKDLFALCLQAFANGLITSMPQTSVPDCGPSPAMTRTSDSGPEPSTSLLRVPVRDIPCPMSTGVGSTIQICKSQSIISS
ncbi:MAG: hypothetical protein JJU40_15095 [Rhodobacteraceae bacterium]|nr:hypothetical protein [Paracoccaceae bacterium]